MLRYLSFKKPLDILFLVACLVFTADVLVPEIWGHGKTKDYGPWFWAGQQVLHGADLYTTDPNGYLNFIYPPMAAILLAIPSALGKIPLYLALSFLNAAAWWITVQLSNATVSEKIPVLGWRRCRVSSRCRSCSTCLISGSRTSCCWR